MTTAAIPPPPQLLDPYERGKQLRQHDAAKPTPGSNSTRHILKPAGTKEVGRERGFDPTHTRLQHLATRGSHSDTCWQQVVGVLRAT